ncbi:hypothetical protein [Stenotrophomonas sp. SORGH_AS_0282]|uniref:hypothetical protein n=1 Tax=Stenotrophomonas sp. SORGH_AS_0282 TaxID=3041763 RepID=UPI002788A0CA|nr:hypothetical protein [Stenotrophomonas sp. SORGH_AS_0282]MDQ1061274.1 hypothetical protein [Stenotrophomonas sp. SORGH_AS_0282]MDQ1190377.1 hypothetical protein [Stenotrophomonas sp. SORGH_AS_0282]
MEPSKIDPAWPNALRWFLSQGLARFTPWHFLSDASDFAFASRAFQREDVSGGEVFVFASRQDCDDFAGLLIVDGRITDRVVYFHPVFADSSQPSPRTWNIVCDAYEDVFEFVKARVIEDMKEWALFEDAADL